MYIMSGTVNDTVPKVKTSIKLLKRSYPHRTELRGKSTGSTSRVYLVEVIRHVIIGLPNSKRTRDADPMLV